MVVFGAPIFLVGFPIVFVAGLWALWRGKHARQPVSSARLWEHLTDSAAGAKRRAVDPVWLLVFLAGMLAALGLGGPRWRVGPSPDAPAADVEWSMRSVGDGGPELFLRIRHGKNLDRRGGMAVEWADEKEPVPWEKLATAGESISLEDALRGTTLQEASWDGASAISVRLHGGGAVLATATFVRPERAPFGLLTQTGSGRMIDAALYRVFAINPAARADDPRVPPPHPAVLLVDDPHFVLEDEVGETLVIASADTPLPGVTLGEEFSPGGAGGAVPTGVSLPGFVDLSEVRVRGAREVKLSGEWSVLATVAGPGGVAVPWLAERRMGAGGVTVLWVGSRPVHETNWPLDRSFVLFFSDLLGRTFGAAGEAGATTVPAGGGVLDWREVQAAGSESRAGVAAEISLGAGVGVAAMGLLAAAMAMFMRRGRG